MLSSSRPCGGSVARSSGTSSTTACQPSPRELGFEGGRTVDELTVDHLAVHPERRRSHGRRVHGEPERPGAVDPEWALAFVHEPAVPALAEERPVPSRLAHRHAEIRPPFSRQERDLPAPGNRCEAVVRKPLPAEPGARDLALLVHARVERHLADAHLRERLVVPRKPHSAGETVAQEVEVVSPAGHQGRVSARALAGRLQLVVVVDASEVDPGLEEW